MPYAQGRTYYDADSHIMELPDFLRDHADPDMKGRLPQIHVDAPRLKEGLVHALEHRSHRPEQVEEMVALGDALISGPKGYMALGAFNAAERKQALDQLGFAKQLVFATFSAGVAFRDDRPNDERYGAARAHNRAMGEFCRADSRLMGVALLPLDDPDMALIEIDHIVKQGLRAAWVPHRPAGGRSPGHNDLDPVWAKLAGNAIPFMLHVGGSPLQIAPEWMNTGRPVPTDWLGGGENVRGKDMTSLHQAAETFVSVLVMDGVFDRHPELRGGVIELGAGWVPQMIKRLDWAADIWKKSEPDLAALKRKPSEQILTHMAFTPYPYEDVGDLIRQSDSRLYMFSSDYPHTEGGRQPLGRFAATMQGVGAEAEDNFYAANFARLFDGAV